MSGLEERLPSGLASFCKISETPSADVGSVSHNVPSIIASSLKEKGVVWELKLKSRNF